MLKVSKIYVAHLVCHFVSFLQRNRLRDTLAVFTGQAPKRAYGGWFACSLGVIVGSSIVDAQDPLETSLSNDSQAETVEFFVEDLQSGNDTPSPPLPQFAVTNQLVTSWDFSDRQEGQRRYGGSVQAASHEKRKPRVRDSSKDMSNEEWGKEVNSSGDANSLADLEVNEEAEDQLAVAKVDKATIPLEVNDSSNLLALRRTIADFAAMQNMVIDLRNRMTAIQQEFQATEQQWRLIDWGRARELEVALNQQFQTVKLLSEFQGNRRGNANSAPPIVLSGVRPNGTTATGVIRGEDAQEVIRTYLANRIELHEEQMRQLNGAQRSLILGRMRLVQEMNSLQMTLGQIEIENNRFAERYWIHSDPERRYTGLEIKKNLYLLELANYDDLFAKLTSALLHEKLGEYEYAANICEELIQKNTPLANTAKGVKVYLRLLQNRDAKKSSKIYKQLMADLHAVDVDALKSGTIFDKWLMAEIYILQGQWANADRQLRGLKKISKFEMPARRRLAQIYSVKANSKPALMAKSLVESQEAFELEPIPDWHAHAILALAFSVNREFSQSIEQLEQAAELALGDQIPLIQSMKAASEAEQEFEWDLFRIIAQVELNEEQTRELDELNASVNSEAPEEVLNKLDEISGEASPENSEPLKLDVEPSDVKPSDGQPVSQ